VKKVLDGGKPDKDYIAIPHKLLNPGDATNMDGLLWTDQLRNAK
jgi:hypothetical protein